MKATIEIDTDSKQSLKIFLSNCADLMKNLRGSYEFNIKAKGIMK